MVLYPTRGAAGSDASLLPRIACFWVQPLLPERTEARAGRGGVRDPSRNGSPPLQPLTPPGIHSHYLEAGLYQVQIHVARQYRSFASPQGKVCPPASLCSRGLGGFWKAISPPVRPLGCRRVSAPRARAVQEPKFPFSPQHGGSGAASLLHRPFGTFWLGTGSRRASKTPPRGITCA